MGMLMTRPKPAAARPRGRSIPFDKFAAAILDDYRTSSPPVTRQTVFRVGEILDMLKAHLKVRSTADLERDDTVSRFAANPDFLRWNPTTQGAVLGMLHAIYRRGQKLGLIRSIPEFPDVIRRHRQPRSERTKVPSPAAVRRLLDYLQSQAHTWEGRRFHALIATIVLGGLSVTQALRLRVADIELAEDTIWVSGSARRTSSSPPIPVRIGPELKGILAGWLRWTKCEWAFPGKERVGPWHGNGGNKKQPFYQLEAAARAAGVKRIGYRSLLRYHAMHSVPSVNLPRGRPISVRGPHRSVFIGGEETVVTSDDQVLIIEALRRESPRRLSLDEISKLTGVKSPRHVLSRLLEHPICRTAIIEETGTRRRKFYRLVDSR
jgi:integrase